MKIEDFISKKNHAINYTENLLGGIATMKENNTKFLVLLQNNKPCGVFTDKNLLEYLYKQTKLNIRLDLLANNIFQEVFITDSIEHVINIFLSLELRFVVVVDEDGNYRGIINRNSLVKYYKIKENILNTNMRDFPLIPIKKIMLPCSFKEIVDSLYKESTVAFLLQDATYTQRVVTKSNIYLYVNSLDLDGNIATLEKDAPKLINMDTSLKEVVDKVNDGEFEYIILEEKETQCYYAVGVHDIIHGSKTKYGKHLKNKFHTNNDFHDISDVAIIEVCKIGDKFIVSRINSCAKKIFHIKPNASINNLFSQDKWNEIIIAVESRKNIKEFFYPLYGVLRKINVSCYKKDKKRIIKLIIALDGEKFEEENILKSIDFFDKKSLYNHVFYQNFTGIVYTQTDGTLIDANPYIETFLGFSKEELIGKNYFTQILGKDDAESAKKIQAELVKDKAFSTVVTRKFIRKDKVEVWGLLSASLIRCEGSGEDYVLVFVQEYTNYHETQESLAQQKEILSMIFDSVEDFIFFKDASFKYASCNTSLLKALGLKRDEVIGKSDYEIFPKAAAEKFIRHDNIAKETKKKIVIRQKIENQNRSIIGETVLKPRYDKDGKFYGIVGVMHDVTSEIENEERRRIIQGIFDTTDEGIMVTDSNNNIIMINPAFTKVAGYTLEDVKGKNPSILSSGLNKEGFYCQMWESIKSCSRWRGEIWNKRKNGEVYPELLTISLLKDQNGNIVNYIGIFADISEMKEKQEKLEFLAHNDLLTNLSNRTYMEQTLEKLIKQSVVKNSKIAVLFFDLDNFKEINDTYGHSSGDKLLIQVAKRFQKVLEKNDFLARVGGDEFVVILHDFDEKSHVENMAEQIASVFLLPFIVDGKIFNVTCTFGISLYPEDGMNVELLLKNADTAMHEAKKSNRNSYMYYNATMTDALFKKMETLADIRRALKNDEFTLYYQPQFNLLTGKIIGVEALARWKHPIKGLVFPDSFIDLAEESQLIIPMGRIFLKKVCKNIKRWVNMGIDLENFKVAVNISAVQIAYDDVFEMLKEVTQEAGINPKYIEVELTETSIMQDLHGAISLFNKIKDLGLTIAIDDFGTGYSSLAYLKKFPADKIKIDKSFIMDISQDSDDAAITKAILALGKSLKMNIIAEGIEESVQRDFLLSEGCQSGQGYFYSKPIHVKDLEEKYLSTLL